MVWILLGGVVIAWVLLAAAAVWALSSGLVAPGSRLARPVRVLAYSGVVALMALGAIFAGRRGADAGARRRDLDEHGEDVASVRADARRIIEETEAAAEELVDEAEGVGRDLREAEQVAAATRAAEPDAEAARVAARAAAIDRELDRDAP